MTRFQIRLVAAAAVLCLVAAPYVLNPFSITLLNYIGIYSLVAIGLVLLTGVGGIVSFGQAAFVGVAAYATAWTSAMNGHSPWLGLVLAIVLTCGSRGDSRLRDAAPGRAFPVVEHGRMGARDRVPVRQRRVARPLQRHREHSADLDRLARSGRKLADLFT